MCVDNTGTLKITVSPDLSGHGLALLMPKHFLLLLLLPGKCIKRKRLSVYEREREKDRRDSLLRGAPIIACSWLL